MRKVAQSTAVRLPSARIYKDDVTALLDIFKSQSKTVEVEMDRQRLESLDEVKEFDEKTFNEMEISIQNPRMSLNFYRDGAYLHLSDDADIIQLGVKGGILEVLKPRFSRLYRSPSYPFLFLLIGPALISFLSSYALLHWASQYIQVLSLVLIPILIALEIQSIRVGFRHYSTIVMIDSQKKSGFFKRNIDQIVITLITGVILLVLGFVLGKMT